ncbi:MAG: HEAT repeat domain-containing protein [bacterium]|nr:HEAT repeat domain-containing protein [bacterium]
MTENNSLNRILRERDFTGLKEYFKKKHPLREELRGLINHRDRAISYAAFIYMKEQAWTCRNPGILRLWAEMLPKQPEKYSPEAQLLLAQLYLQLSNWQENKTIPNWREGKLFPSVELAWLKTEILVFPETIKELPLTEMLYHAVWELEPRELPDPVRVLKNLVKIEDEFVQTHANSLIRDSLTAGVLTPQAARELAREQCRSTFPEVAEQALELLASPWSLISSFPEEVRDALHNENISIARKAVKILGLRHQGDLLEVILNDEKRPPLLRRDAMRYLGDTAQKESMESVINIAQSDPLFYAESCKNCLEAFHHRGYFVRPEHLDDLVFIYTHDKNWTPRELALLSFTCRHELVEKLGTIKPDDTRWEHLIPVLEAVESEKVKPLLIRLLKETSSQRNRSLLLETLTSLLCGEAEETVLSLLDREPEQCLAALRAFGGARTKTVLYEKLGIGDPLKPMAPALRPYRGTALALLWHLVDEESEERQTLPGFINPEELPEEIYSDLGTRSNPEEKNLLLRAGIAAEADKDFPVHTYIDILARSGSVSAIPVLSDLLLRHVMELHAGEALKEEENTGEYYRVEAEPVIFDSVKKAIRELGIRLYNRKKIRPAILLLAENEEEAGDYFLAEMILDLMEAQELPGGELRIFLESLEPLEHPYLVRRIHRLLRHKNPHVRKIVIRCLARQKAGGLVFNIAGLTAANDKETVRQALLALESFNASWTVLPAIDCLDHGNMNIKKTAAQILGTIGDARAVPKIIYWLGAHDNTGFRELLQNALENILKEGYSSVILTALEEAKEARRKKLLARSLDLKLTPEMVRRLVQEKSSSADSLLQALAEGEIRLSSGSLRDLQLELHLYGLNTETRKTIKDITKEPLPEEIQHIMEYGWHRETVESFLAKQVKPTGNTQWLVQQYLKEWHALLRETNGEQQQRALRWLFEIKADSFSEEDLLFIQKHLSFYLYLLEGFREYFALITSFLEMMERLVLQLTRPESMDLTAWVRSLPAIPSDDGLVRYYLLSQCDFLFTRDDVEMFLADCEKSVSPHENISFLLTEIFELDDLELPEERGSIPDMENALCEPGIAALEEIRRLWPEEIDSRTTLIILILNFSQGTAEQRMYLLDWMTGLQPLNTPEWTLGEKARHSEEARRKKIMRKDNQNDPFSRPRSFELKNELLSLLEDEDEETRHRAAAALLDWPDVEDEQSIVFEAWLQGRIGNSKKTELNFAGIFARYDHEALAERVSVLAEEKQESLLGLCIGFSSNHRKNCIPWLIKLWELGEEEISKRAQMELRKINADILMPVVLAALKENQFAYVDLLGGKVLHTPEADIILELLQTAGEDRRFSLLKERLVQGCVWSPEQTQEDQLKLSGLRKKPERKPETVVDVESERFALYEAAQGDDHKKVLAALRALSKDKSPEAVEVVTGLVGHKNAQINLSAHRCLRTIAHREHYLAITCDLLYDKRPSVICSAIRALSHARYAPAFKDIIDFLEHTNSKIQREARQGVVIIGKKALKPLQYARDHARPDKKEYYQDMIDLIEDML